jgi:hypothetical protein
MNIYEESTPMRVHKMAKRLKKKRSLRLDKSGSAQSRMEVEAMMFAKNLNALGSRTRNSRGASMSTQLRLLR